MHITHPWRSAVAWKTSNGGVKNSIELRVGLKSLLDLWGKTLVSKILLQRCWSGWCDNIFELQNHIFQLREASPQMVEEKRLGDGLEKKSYKRHLENKKTPTFQSFVAILRIGFPESCNGCILDKGAQQSCLEELLPHLIGLWFFPKFQLL